MFSKNQALEQELTETKNEQAEIKQIGEEVKQLGEEVKRVESKVQSIVQRMEEKAKQNLEQIAAEEKIEIERYKKQTHKALASYKASDVRLISLGHMHNLLDAKDEFFHSATAKNAEKKGTPLIIRCRNETAINDSYKPFMSKKEKAKVNKLFTSDSKSFQQWQAEYYVYGRQANGTWGITKISDPDLVADLGALSFPHHGKSSATAGRFSYQDREKKESVVIVSEFQSNAKFATLLNKVLGSGHIIPGSRQEQIAVHKAKMDQFSKMKKEAKVMAEPVKVDIKMGQLYSFPPGHPLLEPDRPHAHKKKNKRR